MSTPESRKTPFFEKLGEILDASALLALEAVGVTLAGAVNALLGNHENREGDGDFKDVDCEEAEVLLDEAHSGRLHLSPDELTRVLSQTRH